MDSTRVPTIYLYPSFSVSTLKDARLQNMFHWTNKKKIKSRRNVSWNSEWHTIVASEREIKTTDVEEFPFLFALSIFPENKKGSRLFSKIKNVYTHLTGIASSFFSWTSCCNKKIDITNIQSDHWLTADFFYRSQKFASCFLFLMDGSADNNTGSSLVKMSQITLKALYLYLLNRPSYYSQTLKSMLFKAPRFFYFSTRLPRSRGLKTTWMGQLWPRYNRTRPKYNVKSQCSMVSH